MDTNTSDYSCLKDKFYGCIASAYIGASMGAAVESWDWKKIDNTYGVLDQLLPYEHFQNGWQRVPGTTESGIERMKMISSAIFKKKGRVSAEDVRRTWIRVLDSKPIDMTLAPFDADLLHLAKSIVPARDFGRYADFSGLTWFARSCHPVGLINAGDPVHAGEDTLEVGQLYHITNGRGVKWAMVVAIAIAEATKPGASVDSVIGKVYDLCDKELVIRELDKQLTYSADCKDFSELRSAFDNEYRGHGMPYPHSFANEVVTKALCVFRMVKGNPKDALLASVNMGRDTSSLATIAAGISGALSGADSLPLEWIKQIDKATAENLYTCDNISISNHSDNLLQSYISRSNHMKSLVDMSESDPEYMSEFV